MRTLVKNLPITHFDVTSNCKLVIGAYGDQAARPAVLLLCATEDGGWESYAVASVNSPEFLTGLPQTFTIAKEYSENEGLWEQLLPLCDENGPFFEVTKTKVTLGYARCRVVQLCGTAARIYEELREALPISRSRH